MKRQTKRYVTRKGKRVVTSKEIIEGDIHRITRTRVTVEPVKPARPSRDEDLPRAGKEHQAINAEPLDQAQDFFLNGCRASIANGYAWVTYPCIKLADRHRIYFNDQAIRTYKLKPGMILMLSMTTTRQEIRLKKIPFKFPNKNTIHREGCYRLHGRKYKCPAHHARLYEIRSTMRGGITLLVKNPGLIGYIFRLRQHTEDGNTLVCRVAEGINVNASIADKLTLRAIDDLRIFDLDSMLLPAE